jgi:hypothetical protein
MEIEQIAKASALMDHQIKEYNGPMQGSQLKARLILEPGESIEEEIVCPACKGILIDPKACLSCEQYYCQSCIAGIVKSGGRCSCGTVIRIKEAHKLVRRILSKYKFRCQFMEQGCEEGIPYDSVLQHDKICEFRPVHCEHEFCDAVVQKKNYIDHMVTCGFKKDCCSFCNNLFLHCDIELHQQNCEKRPAKCPGCDLQMFQIEFQNHLQVCEQITDKCPECNAMLSRKELKLHSKVSCVNEFLKTVTKEVNEEIGSLKKMVLHLSKKLSEQESFFSIRCTICDKFACEVSQRSCNNCTKNYCIPCSRKNMKSCKNCEELVCGRCFTNGDVCQNCSRRKKADKKQEAPASRLSKIANS